MKNLQTEFHLDSWKHLLLSNYRIPCETWIGLSEHRRMSKNKSRKFVCVRRLNMIWNMEFNHFLKALVSVKGEKAINHILNLQFINWTFFSSLLLAISWVLFQYANYFFGFSWRLEMPQACRAYLLFKSPLKAIKPFLLLIDVLLLIFVKRSFLFSQNSKLHSIS